MELQYVVTPITATFMITRDVMEGELELKRVNFNPGIGRHACFCSGSGRSTARAVVLATFFHRHTKIPGRALTEENVKVQQLSEQFLFIE